MTPDAAREWLAAQLRQQPRLESRLLKRARRIGIEASKLRAAAASLEVDTGEPGPLCFWRLPFNH